MYSTRDKILIALARAPGRTLSGTVLARRFDLTRAAAWKQIKALQADGVAIKTRKANGYQMARPFDISLLEKKKGLSTGFWHGHYFFSIPSTQLVAKQAAENGSPEGHFWLAEKQISGRGRLDRRWESSLGGLWFSLLLRPRITPSQVPALTLVAAWAWAETLQKITRLQAKLKWPNDVVIQTRSGWRKVAGILTETSGDMDRTHWVVVGMGINVNNTLPANLRHLGAVLADLYGKPLSRARLLNAFLSRFRPAYRRFEKSGFEAFRKLYWHNYSRPDETVQLNTSHGVITGIARNVDARGALVVESHKQIQSIWEGEIVI